MNDWKDYLEKLRQLEQAVKLTSYWTNETAKATQETAYWSEETSIQVKEYLKKVKNENKMPIVSP